MYHDQKCKPWRDSTHVLRFGFGDHYCVAHIQDRPNSEIHALFGWLSSSKYPTFDDSWMFSDLAIWETPQTLPIAIWDLQPTIVGLLQGSETEWSSMTGWGSRAYEHSTKDIFAKLVLKPSLGVWHQLSETNSPRSNGQCSKLMSYHNPYWNEYSGVAPFKTYPDVVWNPQLPSEITKRSGYRVSPTGCACPKLLSLVEGVWRA